MHRLGWRLGMGIWIGLTVVGWLGYLAFLSGAPGCYWVVQAYGGLLLLTIALIITAVFTTPVFGIAFIILAIASLKSTWRQRTRQGAKKLLTILLIEAMAIAALLPNGILLGDVTSRVAIAPWQVVYRAIYVAPLDNNYGDLMLVKCRWFGLCRQVYRSETDISSAEAAYLDFDDKANRVALHLEGRWVYVRSPGAPPCRERLDSDAYGKCDLGAG